MLLKNAEEFMSEMLETIKRKNHDYAGDGGEYKNFELVAKLGICSAERGILVRMSDKMSRLSSIIEGEVKVKDETIIDTLLDLANYSIILASYLKDSKTSGEEQSVPSGENVIVFNYNEGIQDEENIQELLDLAGQAKLIAEFLASKKENR